MANSTKISEYSTTAANNTSIDSIDIDENCAASGINNAIRSVLKHQADAFTQGTPIKLDQTNNRVMINTTTEGFADYADTLTVADTDHAGITIRSGASSSGSLYFSDATSGSGEYDGYLNYNQSTQKLTVGTAAATRMTIDNSGRVGIGATSMDEMLLIQQTASGANTDVTIRSANDGNSRINFGDQSSDGAGRIDYDHTSNYMAVTTNSSERMRIDSSGKVNIGTTAVDGFLQVKHNNNADVLLMLHDTSGAGGTAVRFKVNGSTVGSIGNSGSGTSYNTSSDYRLKQGVEDMTGAIDRVKALAPKRFQFIADPDTTVDGFLAHEAQAVVPEAITGTHNEVDDDGNAVMQGIDQAKLVPLLTGALKEAITKIETLETEMTALKARVTALEA